MLSVNLKKRNDCIFIFHLVLQFSIVTHYIVVIVDCSHIFCNNHNNYSKNVSMKSATPLSCSTLRDT